MVVVARFISRREADRALSALRSAGFAADLLDYPAGGDSNVRRLGDYRLAVPEPESDEALSILDELYADAPVQEDGGGALPLGAAPVILTPARGSEAPWLSLKQKSSTLTEMFGVALVPFLVLAAVLIVGFVLRAVYNLIVYGQLF